MMPRFNLVAIAYRLFWTSASAAAGAATAVGIVDVPTAKAAGVAALIAAVNAVLLVVRQVAGEADAPPKPGAQ